MKFLLLFCLPLAVFAQQPGLCTSNPPLPDLTAGPSWLGWGNGAENARYQGAGAQLTAAQAASLKLKWAFGFPDAKSVYGQPTVAGGRVFVSVDTGAVYSLDAATGCQYWSYTAAAGVRTAISIGPASDGHGYLAWFGDQKGAAYALNAQTGAQVWKVQVDSHPYAKLTGAPQFYQGRLYVPVASGEEAAAGNPRYECCTFRGSVVALDAYTGKQLWKTYLIPEAAKKTTRNSLGTQRWAPSGVGVWSAPTLDPKHHALYIGTGDSYSEPAARNSDAVVALDLNTGKILWSAQDLANDAWVTGCLESAKSRENCPDNAGPDFDFGASPILRHLPNGKSLLLAPQKSGIVWAHDPDRKGAVVWKTSLVTTPPPNALGQLNFGGSADDRNAYFGLRTGGIVALSLQTGQRAWFAPLDPPAGRKTGDDGATSVIPGVVFSGGWDGILRALSATDGKLLWQFDTEQEFKTVNNVPAQGGSMGAPGPTIAGGMLFAGSGYPGVPLQAGKPGNVLLAFGPE